MTQEQVLLAVAGALIVLGMLVIVTALRRGRRREEARDRVEALLTLVAEPAAAEPMAVADDAWDRPFRERPVMESARVATAHRYVVTLSDTSGSFGVRPGSDLS